MIPYSRQHISKKDIKAVVKVLKSPLITQGPEVQEFEKKFKMKSAIGNIFVAFNSENTIVDFGNSHAILQEFVTRRLELYEKRKAHQLKEFDDQLKKFKRRHAFVSLIVVDKVDLIDHDQLKTACLNKGLELKDDDELLQMTAKSIIGGHKKIESKINDLEEQQMLLSQLSAGDLWMNDLNELKAELLKGTEPKRKR